MNDRKPLVCVHPLGFPHSMDPAEFQRINGDEEPVTCPAGCVPGACAALAAHEEARRADAADRPAPVQPAPSLRPARPADLTRADALPPPQLQKIAILTADDRDALVRLIETLGMVARGDAATVAFWIDEGLKLKINEGGWSPPLGTMIERP